MRIQTLNGECITEEHEIKKSLCFGTGEDLEAFRMKREIVLQWKSDQRFLKENPGATEYDLKHAPKISVALDIKSDEFYVQPWKNKKS